MSIMAMSEICSKSQLRQIDKTEDILKSQNLYGKWVQNVSEKNIQIRIQNYVFK
jgi:hypothetical protein